MSNKENLKVGLFSSWSICILLLLYVPITVIGILSLSSPLDQIPNPYFTLMEIIILLIAPILTIAMASIYLNSKDDVKIYGLIALISMAIMTIITSAVHFVVWTSSRQIQTLGFLKSELLFSFTWPSVVYALDILAWDWFFALAMIFAALTFNDKKLRIVFIASGIISILGLLGVPLANMNVRNIGIIGYTIVAGIAFFMLGLKFKKQVND